MNTPDPTYTCPSTYYGLACARRWPHAARHGDVLTVDGDGRVTDAIEWSDEDADDAFRNPLTDRPAHGFLPSMTFQDGEAVTICRICGAEEGASTTLPGGETRPWHEQRDAAVPNG